MVMPVMKCPYLAQLTLQQVKASAPYILNTGAESCPIFGHLVRRISTTRVSHGTSLNASSTRANFDDTKVFHEKLFARKTTNDQATTSHPYGESK